MRNGRWDNDYELEERCGRLGIVRAANLESLGLDSKTVYRRCLPGGPWRRLLPGIILQQNSPPNDDQRIAAASLYCGTKALLTGIYACRAHGLRTHHLPADNRVHMLVPHDRRVQGRSFVVVERTHRMPAAVTNRNLRMAPLIRAITDAARRLRTSDEVGKLLIEAIQRGHCSPDKLLAELDQGSRRGTALPRRLLKEVEALRSVAELHARRLAHQLRIPQPTHWNSQVVGPDGTVIGRPDAWWDDVGMAWEIDSVEYHYSKQDYARTLRRNTRYASAGIMVVQTLPSRLLRDQLGVLRELTETYRTAASRPRPKLWCRRDAA